MDKEAFRPNRVLRNAAYVALLLSGACMESRSATPPVAQTPAVFVEDGCNQNPYQVVKVNSEFSLEVVDCGKDIVVILVKNDAEGNPTVISLGGISHERDFDGKGGWMSFGKSSKSNPGVTWTFKNNRIDKAWIENRPNNEYTLGLEDLAPR